MQMVNTVPILTAAQGLRQPWKATRSKRRNAWILTLSWARIQMSLFLLLQFFPRAEQERLKPRVSFSSPKGRRELMSYSQRFNRLGRFLGQAQALAEEQAKNFRWGTLVRYRSMVSSKTRHRPRVILTLSAPHVDVDTQESVVVLQDHADKSQYASRAACFCADTGPGANADTSSLPVVRPISKAPYLMAPLELERVEGSCKSCWSEVLSDPVYRHGVQPVLFVKKKDGAKHFSKTDLRSVTIIRVKRDTG
ncbi:hypothetical protein Tco_0578451 [Tanacetum coccineum]